MCHRINRMLREGSATHQDSGARWPPADRRCLLGSAAEDPWPERVLVDTAASGGTGVEQARVFDDARQGRRGDLGESDSGQTGSEQTGPEEAQRQRAAAQMGASTALAAALEWESGLRSRIFHLRRPNIWARLQY